eukprot:snap_masked-scaffold273_size229271-processed-gene-1.12 protein:Tk00754 transcript:snap_masked-scaffold273_size229271-processed-gene-1.12-mRNA-1 annotation:"fmrfamide receptor"
MAYGNCEEPGLDCFKVGLQKSSQHQRFKRHFGQLLRRKFHVKMSNVSEATLNLTWAANTSGAASCDPLTEEEIEFYTRVSWWWEGLLQTLVGTIGFLANGLAVPILCSKDMNSIFNRLLVFLAVFDNIYIVCSVLEGIRKHSGFNQMHEYAFGYVLYQFHNFVLCCSIYITLTLALERYRAVWRPVEYHNRCKGANPWKRIAGYIIPVFIFSAIFNIPKFFEVEFVVRQEIDPVTNNTINQTLASPTDLRLNDSYVIFYVNAARLLVQGIIPFVLLSILNYRIYWVIKRRREMINRPASISQNVRSASAQKKANETQQAVVLFIIVLLFFICHTPRFVLNVHEFLTLESLRISIEQDCNGVSLWALIWASVSHFLMTLNSSVNFFIYCFMCATFRRILFSYFTRCGFGIIPSWCSWGGDSDQRSSSRGEVILDDMGTMMATEAPGTLIMDARCVITTEFGTSPSVMQLDLEETISNGCQPTNSPNGGESTAPVVKQSPPGPCQNFNIANDDKFSLLISGLFLGSKIASFGTEYGREWLPKKLLFKEYKSHQRHWPRPLKEDAANIKKQDDGNRQTGGVVLALPCPTH